MFDWLRKMFRKSSRRAPERPVPRMNFHPYDTPPVRPASKHQALGAARGPLRNDRSDADGGFDAAGFMLGYATGMPVSPSHGFSAGALLGASMHASQEPASHAPSAPSYDPPAPACDTSSSSSSDSSSSSSSYDSGASCSSSGGSDF